MDCGSQITIEQMAATLAHEVKNPIALVMACIDLLEIDDPEAAGKNTYHIMRRELGKVTDMMLDFIQLAKPMETERKEIDVRYMLSAIVENCRELYGAKADFLFLAKEEDFKITGDEGKLKRVFFNVYKNAVEAIGKHGEVKTLLSADEDGFVNISIIDNGAGMTEEVRQKISAPFFTTKESGSGLGVFICRNIIAEHGGTFEIGSESKKGCIVKIRLPSIQN